MNAAVRMFFALCMVAGPETAARLLKEPRTPNRRAFIIPLNLSVMNENTNNTNSPERLSAAALMQATARALDIDNNAEDYPARRLALTLIGVETFRDGLRYMGASSVALLAEIAARAGELYPASPSRRKEAARVLCAAIHNAALLMEYESDTLADVTAISAELCRLPEAGPEGLKLLMSDSSTAEADAESSAGPSDNTALRARLGQLTAEVEQAKQREAEAKKREGVFAGLYEDLCLRSLEAFSSEAWEQHKAFKSRLAAPVHDERETTETSSPQHEDEEPENCNRDEVAESDTDNRDEVSAVCLMDTIDNHDKD